MKQFHKDMLLTVFMAILFAIMVILFLSGCGTPEIIKQNSYNGLQAVSEAVRLNKTPEIAPHLKALEAVMQACAAWTGLPVIPSAYKPDTAIETAVNAKETAESLKRLEDAVKGIPRGDGVGLTELIIALVGYYGASKGTNVLATKLKRKVK